MLDNKIIIIGVAILVVVGLVVFMRRKKTTEGFLGMLPRFTTTISREVAADQAAAAKGQFYSVPGFQGILSPRAASVNYGANIRHNMPAYENQGIPCNPLVFGNMAMGADWGGAFNTGAQASKSSGCPANSARMSTQKAPTKTVKQGTETKEGYQENYGCGGGCGSGCTPASCNTDGTAFAYHSGAPLMKADYTEGNYAEVLEDVMKNSEPIDSTGTLPVPTMATVNALGEISQQPIVYDRLITTTGKNRLQALGDKIRGDPAIGPQNFGWFNSQWAFTPVSTLQQGAMGVITDPENSNFRQLAELINKTSGTSTIAGVNIATLKESELGFAESSLNITGFP